MTPEVQAILKRHAHDPERLNRALERERNILKISAPTKEDVIANFHMIYPALEARKSTYQPTESYTCMNKRMYLKSGFRDD